MDSRLFCTFSSEKELDTVLKSIQESYTIIYNKIFVLYSKDQDEYMCTYNVDLQNISHFPEDTILVHRKKRSRTLYTINALNELIKSLNNGVLDISYKINWLDYENCILLTKNAELKRIDTKLFKIVETN